MEQRIATHAINPKAYGEMMIMDPQPRRHGSEAIKEVRSIGKMPMMVHPRRRAFLLAGVVVVLFSTVLQPIWSFHYHSTTSPHHLTVVLSPALPVISTRRAAFARYLRLVTPVPPIGLCTLDYLWSVPVSRRGRSTFDSKVRRTVSRRARA